MRQPVHSWIFALSIPALMLIQGHAGESTPSTPEKEAPEPKPPDKNPPKEPLQTKELLPRLGSESFEEREDATVALIQKGAAALDEIASYEKSTQDAEVQVRCAKIRAAIGNPAQTALGVLALIESSKATFLRPGAARFKVLTGEQFAAHLRAKATFQKFTLTRPAAEFIDEVAAKSTLHGQAYRIKLEDGTEKELKEWLEEKAKVKP